MDFVKDFGANVNTVQQLRILRTFLLYHLKVEP